MSNKSSVLAPLRLGPLVRLSFLGRSEATRCHFRYPLSQLSLHDSLISPRITTGLVVTVAIRTGRKRLTIDLGQITENT